MYPLIKEVILQFIFSPTSSLLFPLPLPHPPPLAVLFSPLLTVHEGVPSSSAPLSTPSTSPTFTFLPPHTLSSLAQTSIRFGLRVRKVVALGGVKEGVEVGKMG